jgi:hypothetical protein
MVQDRKPETSHRMLQEEKVIWLTEQQSEKALGSMNSIPSGTIPSWHEGGTCSTAGRRTLETRSQHRIEA